MPYPQYQHCIAIAGSRQLAPYTGLMRFPAPVPGSIVRVEIVSKGAVNNNGDAVFDCTVEGVSIFSDPGNRPKILSGQSSGVATFQRGDADALVNRLDEVVLNLVSVPDGGIGGPLWFIIQIDGSVTARSFVKQLYIGALARNPDSTEWTDGIDDLESAFTTPLAIRVAMSALCTGVFTLAEYIARGRTDTQFIDDLYLGILGRVSDAAGHDYWFGQLATQGGALTRAAAAALFSSSSEMVNERLFEIWPGGALYADAHYIAGVPLNFGALSDGDAIVYDEASGRFINGAGAGGSATLGGKAIVGSPTVNGQTLMYSSDGDNLVWRLTTDGPPPVADLFTTRTMSHSPLRYYKLAETSGIVAMDTAGNSNGTYIGGPTPVTGLMVGDPDGAMSFDGSNDGMNDPQDNAMQVSVFTVYAIVKRVLGQLLMVGGYDANNSQVDGRGWSFYVLTDGMIGGQVGVGTGSYHTVRSAATPITAATAFFVAMIYNQVTLKLYWGSLAAAVSNDGSENETGAISYTGGGRGMTVGYRRNGVNSDLFCPGTIEKVAFVPSALTITQLEQLRGAAFGLG